MHAHTLCSQKKNRYGIRAFDTSPYYGASEIILGRILQALRDQYPRESYSLITKCGRYGVNPEEFDYTPSTIRKSVLRSLKRLDTTYLDVVYLHDVEFVSTRVRPTPNSGRHADVLQDPKLARDWGIGVGDEGKVWGDGDQNVLDALMELRRMKDEGLIRAIGISGYPLPTLLRLALLILHKTGKPLDIIMSFSHYDLQNATFPAYVNVLHTRARIDRVLTASAFNMGLLTDHPPGWHPAPPELVAAVNRVKAWAKGGAWPEGLANLALGFSMRRDEQVLGKDVPIVLGLSSPQEIHECVKVWREVVAGESALGGDDDERAKKRKETEEAARRLFAEDGMADWSWDQK